MFKLISPCAKCPFRRDVPGYLRPERVASICDALLRDQSFICHATLKLPSHDRQHCAGATIFLERQGRPNQMMRVSERLGLYDHRKLNMDAPVFLTAGEAIAHHYAAGGSLAHFFPQEEDSE